MNVQDIPGINAVFNALATVLMTAGFVFVMRARGETDPARRAARIRSHRACMLSAGVVSMIFLVGYVSHKILVRGAHTKSGGEGAIATVYYTMLISHIILAAAIAFLVPRTFFFALKGNFERHRKWARWTFPIWYYVSVTGVLVYFFLYQWWPVAPKG